MHIDLVVKMWSCMCTNLRTSNTHAKDSLSTNKCKQLTQAHDLLLHYDNTVHKQPIAQEEEKSQEVENKLIWNLWGGEGGGTLNDHTKLSSTKP
jgi:fructose-1,6-bisphosphatase